MSEFKYIGLLAKSDETRVKDTLTHLVDFLQDRGHEVLMDQAVCDYLGDHLNEVDCEELGQRADLVIVVGGDGTMLNAARRMADYDIPILGINLGRLGFLVDISPDEMEGRLTRILDGDYVEENRFLLQGSVFRDEEEIFTGSVFNDIVYHVRDVVRMIEFETHIDGVYVNTQRSDGMVISTPSGSTAYAMSAGGPIIEPGLNAIVLAPICPHTLTNRPIVVSSDSKIDVIASRANRASGQVSFDGQTNVDILNGDRIHIRRKPKPARLLHPSDHNYFHILRAKLHWGEQP